MPALGGRPRSGQPKKYGPGQEAEVVALACNDAPEGRAGGGLEGKGGHGNDQPGNDTADVKKKRM